VVHRLSESGERERKNSRGFWLLLLLRAGSVATLGFHGEEHGTSSLCAFLSGIPATPLTLRWEPLLSFTIILGGNIIGHCCSDQPRCVLYVLFPRFLPFEGMQFSPELRSLAENRDILHTEPMELPASR
jgi:hypothetical protein